METLARVLDGIDRLNEWLGKTFSILAIVLTLVVVYDVVLRYFFARPTIWGLELSCILLAYLTFMGGGYAFLHGGHVKVDFFYQKWTGRTKATVDLLTYTLIIAYCSVLVWQGGAVAWEAIQEARVSTSAWAPPLWPSQIMVPIGALLVGLQALAHWIRDFRIAWSEKNDLASKVFTGEGGIFEKKKE
ncbi:MAG TPA: TRAP transporter small permease subunit [Thermodesulfobacteriota bacterium]|nr:TRAP transporter small permease subunit [Thermodesulfobacteriota bacterium]